VPESKGLVQFIEPPVVLVQETSALHSVTKAILKCDSSLERIFESSLSSSPPKENFGLWAKVSTKGIQGYVLQEALKDTQSQYCPFSKYPKWMELLFPDSTQEGQDLLYLWGRQQQVLIKGISHVAF